MEDEREGFLYNGAAMRRCKAEDFSRENQHSSMGLKIGAERTVLKQHLLRLAALTTMISLHLFSSKYTLSLLDSLPLLSSCFPLLFFSYSPTWLGL